MTATTSWYVRSRRVRRAGRSWASSSIPIGTRSRPRRFGSIKLPQRPDDPVDSVENLLVHRSDATAGALIALYEGILDLATELDQPFKWKDLSVSEFLKATLHED